MRRSGVQIPSAPPRQRRNQAARSRQNPHPAASAGPQQRKPARPMTPTDAVPQSLLRHRPFMLFWYARIFTAVAFQMMFVAVGWQIYELTGRAFDLGLVGLIQFLP